MPSTQTSTALVKRSTDSALMAPPPPPKRIKRPAKVLDEDTYTDAISHIIARDFFPGLIESKSQEEYLNALDSQDSEWIASAKRKLSDVTTPGPDGRRLRGRRGTSMTPINGFRGIGGTTPRVWQGDTPVSSTSVQNTDNIQAKEPEVDINLSLSAFQSKYTSEDNESFYKLLDKQNSKRSEKYSWMWAGNKIPAARQIAHRIRKQKLLSAVEERSAIGGKDNALMKSDDDDRPAMPDSWNAKPDNNLMFAPLSVEDSHQTVAQKAEDTSRAPPKAVVYDNTRLPTSTTSSDPSSEIPPSPSLSAVQEAIAGRPRPTASEADFGPSRAETPRVNGYAFVDSEEPSPPSTPVQDHLSLLGSSDSTPNPFSIKASSRREELHYRMVDKVAKGKRVKNQIEAMKTPVPRFVSSPRVARGGLTPAGQKLFGKVAGGMTPAIGSTPGVWERDKKRSSLREEWTPRT